MVEMTDPGYQEELKQLIQIWGQERLCLEPRASIEPVLVLKCPMIMVDKQLQQPWLNKGKASKDTDPLGVKLEVKSTD